MAVKSKKIIIIGAGIAGLAASNYLSESGFDVSILEARNRAGGRIWTDYTLGLPLGAGASWIHGAENNPISLLAEKFSTKMLTVDPEQFVIFDREGKAIAPTRVDKFNVKFDTILKKAKEASLHAAEDIPLSESLKSFIQKEDLSSIEKDLLKVKISFFEAYVGNNYESLSARHWDQDEAWPGDNCFLLDSYQPILDGLLSNSRVELNSVVTKINTYPEGIEVFTKNGLKFYGDAALVTVPLGTLKKNTITFDPPLPKDKKNAIENLGMGLFNITAMKFPIAFWPKKPHAMFFTQFDSLSISTFFNLNHFIEEPIIIGFSGGRTASHLETLTDNELIQKIMLNFKMIFGNDIPDPESFFNTRWSIDPFSYGSYSHLPVGASKEDYENLAKPISNQLFFAGEATNASYPASTHGAYLSGIREAQRIKSIFT